MGAQGKTQLPRSPTGKHARLLHAASPARGQGKTAGVAPFVYVLLGETLGRACSPDTEVQYYA